MSKERSEAKAAIVANLGQALAAQSEAIGKVTEALRLARAVVLRVEYLKACDCKPDECDSSDCDATTLRCPCCGGLRPSDSGRWGHRDGCDLARLKELLG